MSSFDYDMVIIGSGLDGSVAALRATACPLWHKADMAAPLADVRFCGNCGHHNWAPHVRF